MEYYPPPVAGVLLSGIARPTQILSPANLDVKCPCTRVRPSAAAIHLHRSRNADFMAVLTARRYRGFVHCYIHSWVHRGIAASD